MDNIILWIMAIAMVLGALDRMFGSRLGLGKQFEEGILAIGALSLSMLGILTLAPVLARLLRPVLVPVYGFLGADPAMFAGSILANDMGGAPLAMELAGSFPLVFLLTKLLRRPLAALGRLLGMNGTAAAGLVASLANSIPMFGMVKDMDERGKIVNIAFAVPAAFVFGDHLGFTAGYDAAMLGPVIAAKLTGGVLAVLAALLFTRKKPAQNM